MTSKLENKLPVLSSYLAGLILVLVPFWAFISVWLSSGLGHYTVIRLVIEIVLLLLAASVGGSLLLKRELVRNLAVRKWLWPLLAFVLLEIIWGAVAYFGHSVSLKALGYAWIVDLRYILFFLAVFLLAGKSSYLSENWRKLIIIPAILVAVFAVLQVSVLPLNFLGHFGYSPHTIFPYETINHNNSYPRAMGFTRGANPLGAYLLVVITLLAAFLAEKRNRLWRVAALVLCIVALIFSFSRSAWIGAVVSLGLVTILAITNTRARKILLAAGGVLIVIVIILFLGFRGNAQFQNYFLHTQTHSASPTSSDQNHLSAFRVGFNDFSSNPLGNGPGTAGPASVYNNDAPARISENYYLMIGEEDGWLGLALLLAFFVLVALELARQRTKLALGLFASFIGLAIVNFLLPAWTDVTLAYIFWGLAGVALASKAGKIKLYERKANTGPKSATDKKAAGAAGIH